MEKKAREIYQQFDSKRKKQAAIQADEEDLQVLHNWKMRLSEATDSVFVQQHRCIVPTLRVGMHPKTLSVKRESVQSALSVCSHAERGNNNGGEKS